MNASRSLRRCVVMGLIVLSLIGCVGPKPTPEPTLPPPPPPGTPLPIPATPSGPGPETQTQLLKFIQTVAVTPDETFLTGGFARMGYVPATDHLVVTFGAPIVAESSGASTGGFDYKVYTVDMQPTGEWGVVSPEVHVADIGGVFVENVYYFAAMANEGGKDGWFIGKYDAVTWEEIAHLFLTLDAPREQASDMMVAFVNGILDVSAEYTPSGEQPPLHEGTSTHHQLFTPDLQFIEKRVLADTPHIEGSSMIFVDGIYYFVSASALIGDVIVMKYDQDWNDLGMKELVNYGNWAQGLAFDGGHFFVSYLDTPQRPEPEVRPNIRLAVLDPDWNLLEDVAVTDFKSADQMFAGRPYVLVHGNRLYVAYDVAPVDPDTGSDDLDNIQAYVSVYELTPNQ